MDNGLAIPGPGVVPLSQGLSYWMLWECSVNIESNILSIRVRMLDQDSVNMAIAK